VSLSGWNDCETRSAMRPYHVPQSRTARNLDVGPRIASCPRPWGTLVFVVAGLLFLWKFTIS
jgi:hypothetical protein